MTQVNSQILERKQAIIKLIEKRENDKRHISNWRSISLINVDTKVGPKAIARKVQHQRNVSSYRLPESL